MAPTKTEILDAIDHRAVNASTRYLQEHALVLSYAEADQHLDDAARGWLRERLGCGVEETDDGVSINPPRDVSGGDAP